MLCIVSVLNKNAFKLPMLNLAMNWGTSVTERKFDNTHHWMWNEGFEEALKGIDPMINPTPLAAHVGANPGVPVPSVPKKKDADITAKGCAKMSDAAPTSKAVAVTRCKRGDGPMPQTGRKRKSTNENRAKRNTPPSDDDEDDQN